MVVDDDHVETRLDGRFHRLVRGDPAIDGDDQRAAALLPGQQGGKVRAVALVEAVRDVDRDLDAERREDVVEDGGRTRPVDIVVAEDTHFLPRRDRLGQTGGGGVHVGKA